MNTDIVIELHCPEVDEETKTKMIKAIKNNYGMEIDDADYDIAKVNSRSWIYGIIGLAILIFNLITEKYIGAIVGSLTVANTNIDCEIKNCYINSSYREETPVTTSQITLGVYGYKDTAATIENCYKLEN